MTYYIRLDDACEKRDIQLWDRMEELLDKYSIKPLVGIIPHCEDPMMDRYTPDSDFWKRVDGWICKGWGLALHGYTHVFCSNDGGINPVNKRSEFAGVSLEEQKRKIHSGVGVLRSHDIDPKVFFAPAHTFDMNTLEALKAESNIRIISDTAANKPYNRWGFTFIPQQSGHVRKLPFNTVTFCYHPNTMQEKDFQALEKFLQTYHDSFKPFPTEQVERRYGIIDRIVNYMYFARRK